jgi:hypothetical protein
MKKTLLIITGLMALGLPIQAAQATQVSQANQAKVSQQTVPIQIEKGMCIIRNNVKHCY